MRIIYCQKMSFPTRSAHAIHTVMTVANMARAGAAVEFFPGVKPSEMHYLEGIFKNLGFDDDYKAAQHIERPTPDGNINGSISINTIPFTHKSVYGLLFRFTLLQSIRKKGQAVCYATSVKEAVMALSLRKLCGLSPEKLPVVFEIHHLISNLKSGKKAVKLCALEEKAFRECDMIVFISEALQKIALEQLPKPKLTLLSPLGFNENTIKPIQYQAAAGSAAAVSKTPDPAIINLTYLGSLQAGKGVENLIEAMGMLPPNYHLTILGGYPQKSLLSLQELAKERKLETKVTFAGQIPQSQLTERLAPCDIFVIPISTVKDFFCPIKMYEAVGFALPVVTTPAPSITEWLTDGKNAVVADDFSATALARAIEKLGEDAALRESLRQNNALLAPQLYSGNRAKILLQELAKLL